jgi:hypothetical protein
MFWFRRKSFVGSYLFLSVTHPSDVSRIVGWLIPDRNRKAIIGCLAPVIGCRIPARRALEGKKAAYHDA